MFPGFSNRKRLSCVFAAWFSLILCLFGFYQPLAGDEPYAPVRDYDLQHSKISLRFDVKQKKVFGEVTHSLEILTSGTSKIAFDSVGLNIEAVAVNKTAVKFETTPEKLIVSLPAAGSSGDKFEVSIRYQGTPSKGLFFILPDKDFPSRPIQIWTQGESEDTRYYLPTYDYPNDRLTTETILTVPASWTTVSNGKLVSVTDAGNGQKTWDWQESLPSSTYLITIVAGELDEWKELWRGIPVTYYAPKGRRNRIPANYARTPVMMELFSRKLGVDYPWEKYSQAMVDEFDSQGMENSSATTNGSFSLHDPRLASELPFGEDELISHELGHQWFGDLVTCKDWADLWLNEGFATLMEWLWIEEHYGKDEADMTRWNAANDWWNSPGLWGKPIVRHDFSDSSEFDGNAYKKGGLVLHMLRRQLGDEAFFLGLKLYLQVNRGKNVETADFVKAVEETAYADLQPFFNQWIYGAGAPKLDVSYSYDSQHHQVLLSVRQTQKRDEHVGLFQVPVEVEITTASGTKLHKIAVSKEEEAFSLPTDSAPLIVLFDRGGQILKSVYFHKDKQEWLYQLQHAAYFADRADAVAALGRMRKDEEVVAALAESMKSEKSWGVRALAADKLGSMGTASAARALLDALNETEKPWVRVREVSALGNYDDPGSQAKLVSLAKADQSWRARAAALQAISRVKPPQAFSTLEAAVVADSPDDLLRETALRALGSLGDDRAVPLLQKWTVRGKPTESRASAISALARLDVSNPEITAQIETYLAEPHSSIRVAAIYGLGARGDLSAIPALESLLKSSDLSKDLVPIIESQIARLRDYPRGKPAGE